MESEEEEKGRVGEKKNRIDGREDSRSNKRKRQIDSSNSKASMSVHTRRWIRSSFVVS